MAHFEKKKTQHLTFLKQKGRKILPMRGYESSKGFFLGIQAIIYLSHI